MSAYTLSPAGIDFLKKEEGVRHQVYDDKTGKPVRSFSEVSGYPTIGIGHLIADSERSYFSKYLVGNQEMPMSEVLAIFQRDVAEKFERVLNARVKGRINQLMWDALVIQAYNTGPNTNALKTTIEHINAGNYDQSVLSFATRPVTSKGVVVQGLINRREKELKMFGTGVFELKRQLIAERTQAVTSPSSSTVSSPESSPVSTDLHVNTPTWVFVAAGLSASTLLLLAAFRIRRRMKITQISVSA